MNRTIGALSLFLALGLSTQVQAESFTFSGSANGGTGSATMDVTISGNQVTAVVENTSPILMDDGISDNTPGITAIGLNLEPDTLVLTSWTLHALDSTGSITLIADGTAGQDWEMQMTQAGVSLDYLPGTGGQIDGALFNPDLMGSGALPGGQNDVWFTTATLVLNFDSAISGLGSENCGSGLGDCSTFVRMQRVGDGGSLKLPGEPCGPNDPNCGGGPGGHPTPEPGTMFLMGSGLAGLGFWRWKKGAKTQA